MKKLLTGLLMLGGIGMWAVSSHAALTADLTITVTPTGTKSVALSQATLAYGSLSVNSTNNISSSVTVTNDGNIAETFGMHVTSVGGIWSLGGAAGNDIINLRAIFNAAVTPLAAEFAADDDLTLAHQASTGAVFSDGTETGDSVSPVSGSNGRGLWFKLDMPTMSSVTALQSIVVRVTAN